MDVETIVIDDEASRGPSWARNRGLERATGEIVFFCDADDEVESDFFARPLAALTAANADLCFFSYEGGPRQADRVFTGNAAVRAEFLPAFFGYSNEDVRRWNAGGALNLRKQMGQVWRCVFRREFLERNGLRFDEAMTLFEDAAFLSACVAVAEKVATIPDKLYRYRPQPTGNLATGWRGRRNWDYKFIALAFRKQLNEKCHGEIWPYCEASCVFSALELLKARYRVREYVKDEGVRAALRSFPLSLRHPLVAAAVLFLRCL